MPVTREAVLVISKKLVSSGNKKPVSGVQQIDCVCILCKHFWKFTKFTGNC